MRRWLPKPSQRRACSSSTRGPARARPRRRWVSWCARWATDGRSASSSSSRARWDTGEKHALARFDDLVSWHTMGEGFTWETQDRARDVAAAERAWAKACELMDDPEIRMVVLDELNIALRYDYLPLDVVVARLAVRRGDLHVVVTGRNAKAGADRGGRPRDGRWRS